MHRRDASCARVPACGHNNTLPEGLQSDNLAIIVKLSNPDSHRTGFVAVQPHQPLQPLLA